MEKWGCVKVGFWESWILGKLDFGKWDFEKVGCWESVILGKWDFGKVASRLVV